MPLPLAWVDSGVGTSKVVSSMHHGTSMVQLTLPLSIYILISELHGEHFEGDVLKQELPQRAWAL
jgi:hypothetical protein